MSLENPHIIIQQLTPFERIPQQRMHPPRQAKSYLSGQHPELLRQSRSESTTKNHAFTDAEQEEKFALAGIVADWMVQGANEMRKHRPPFGLAYSISGSTEDFSKNNIKVLKDANLLGDPFSTFAFTVNHTLAISLRQKVKQILATPEGREAAIYKRHMYFANRSGISPDDPDGIQYSVIPSGTGLRIMGAILAHANDIDSTLLGRKPTVGESANAARNSTPLIIKLASFEKNIFNTIFVSVAEGGGISKSLMIVENDGKMYYQIKDSVLQAAINQLSKPDVREKVEREKRAGCPARMRFDGRKSAIETLWNWYIDYSVQVSQNKTVDTANNTC